MEQKPQNFSLRRVFIATTVFVVSIVVLKPVILRTDSRALPLGLEIFYLIIIAMSFGVFVLTWQRRRP